MLNEWGEESYQFILDSFKEKYPHITVEVVDMPYNDVLSKYQAAAAAGEAFDVFATEVSWNVPLYTAGYLEDLNPGLKRTRNFPTRWHAKFTICKVLAEKPPVSVCI